MESVPRTLEEIKTMTKEFLTPKEVSGVLGCDPYKINAQAQHDPKMLGFPVCVMGSRVKIPRSGFLNWIDGSLVTREIIEETLGAYLRRAESARNIQRKDE